MKPVDDVNPSKQQFHDSFVFNYGLTHKDFDRIMQTIPTVVGATPLREFRKNVRITSTRSRAGSSAPIPTA